MREEIVNWWLQRQLAAELSKISGADVKTEDVRYRDGVLSAGLCRVSGENMPFASLEIRDARVPIDWERIKNPAGEPLQRRPSIWSGATPTRPVRREDR